jgi:hypothetical protein
MNEQQLSAIKHSIEILKSCNPENEPLYEQVCAYELAVSKTITALQSIISQDALDKMAEDAVTIGLRLDDWDKIGCVNHDCDKCKAVQLATVQEPIGYFTVNGYDMWEQIDDTGGKPLYEHAAPQPVPVKTYHDGKPWPVAPKPWVGLSEKDKTEIRYLSERDDRDYVMALVESKLKEKNHDH